ncbi:hypothetical protein GCM10011399_06170 [Subtercola lobariae]|uniref:Secreted protein n=1 Tax=Subtercola lobariae TaxID=1588641 RepID=A0A917B1M0_9MICO|nr:hypothetical protein GCM10011399_06170 [Subtercola lobariae]
MTRFSGVRYWGTKLLKIASTVLIAGAICVVGVAAPAEASTGPGGQVITCTIKTNYPHNSGHVFGTVNVTADVLCSAPVGGLNVNVALQRNGATTSTGRSQNGGQNYLSANAAVGCVNGRYQGLSHISVTFPAGFSPSVAGTDSSSISRNIDCSVAGFANDDGGETVVTTIVANQNE